MSASRIFRNIGTFSCIIIFILVAEIRSVRRYPGTHTFIQPYHDGRLIAGRDFVDLCDTTDGRTGECRPPSDCWISDYDYISLESCQFYDGVEFFCCPDENNRHINPIDPNLPTRPEKPRPPRPQKPLDGMFNPVKEFIDKFVVPGLGALIQTGTASSVPTFKSTTRPPKFRLTTKYPRIIFPTKSSIELTTTKAPSYIAVQNPSMQYNFQEVTKAPSTDGFSSIQTVSQQEFCGQRTRQGVYSKKELEPFILGGSNVQEDSWPWMAAIYAWNQFGYGRYICGGSLITERHILSAAHCFENKSAFVRYSVILGSTTLDSKSETSSYDENHIYVSRIKKHDQFIDNVYHHDIAILTLGKNVRQSDKISTICLPATQDFNLVSPQTSVTVIGWGDTSYGGTNSNILQEAKLQIMNFRHCQNSYQRFRSKSLPHGITSSMFCAGTSQGTGDSCQGDSGGPLMVERGHQWIQLGIISFGYQCGVKEYPGVYTKVSSYLPWIQRILEEERF